jgi:hypothetical protein
MKFLNPNDSIIVKTDHNPMQLLTLMSQTDVIRTGCPNSNFKDRSHSTDEVIAYGANPNFTASARQLVWHVLQIYSLNLTHTIPNANVAEPINFQESVWNIETLDLALLNAGTTIVEQ